MTEVFLGVAVFTGVVLALVGVILAARARLEPGGEVQICINDQQTLTVSPGGKLLNILADNGVFVSSACGGGGTCAQCKVHVHEGGGDILATETGHISKREAREGMRLSCQVAVKQDMQVDVEVAGQLTRGMTVFDRRREVGAPANVEVCVDVDEQGVVDYLSRLLTGP